MKSIDTLSRIGTCAAALAVSVAACGPDRADDTDYSPVSVTSGDTLGYVEAIDPAFFDLVPSFATIEVLASGFTWSEGPVWIPTGDFLLFSDVPENVVHKWDSGTGLTRWLTPSGDTGHAEGAREGSNGLLLDRSGRLVLCQHGDRRVARLDAPLDDPAPRFTTLTDRFGEHRFNSPNDATFHSNGDLYFTDPPYGLTAPSNSELGFQGVYRLEPDGTVHLLTSELSRPNGIALMPDERTLIVANSDGDRPVWMAYDLDDDGGLSAARVFFDASDLALTRPGLPDGLKVDVNGNVFATGPGGVLVLSRDGQHLGSIRLPIAAANLAFGDDGRSLYVTADMYLLRVRVNTRGRLAPG